MGATFDAAASGVGAGAGPFTYSHTCSGSNRVLFVKITYYDSMDTVSAVSYNGVAMTLIPGSDVANGQYHVEWYYLINPATGPNTVSVTMTGSVYDIGIASISVTDAHQTTPYGTPVTGTGTGTTPSVVVASGATELVLDGIAIVHSGTLTVGAGQTQRANAICGSGFIKHAASSETGAASTTMSWSNSSSQVWASSAFAVKPAAAGFQAAWARGSNVVIGSGAR